MTNGIEYCRRKKGVFSLFFSAIEKSHFSYEKGMKTNDFLKKELVCELIQKELD